MKAANLHARHPDRNILYTFHTQSLYNHVRRLISLFYRDSTGIDPDWDFLNISIPGAVVLMLAFTRTYANELEHNHWILGAHES
jgi:hypothetical protein